MIGDKTVLFMANHGISTVGETVADAYDRLYYIERAAQVQIYAMWTGAEAEAASRARGRKDQARYRRQQPVPVRAPAQRHFDALKRMLDRKEPDYAT